MSKLPSIYEINAKAAVEYFIAKYGEERARFICKKIAPALYQPMTSGVALREMGDKIALLNGWR